MKKLGVLLAVMLTAGTAMAAGDVLHPKQQSWPFDGVMGKVDKPSAQRGLQVYKDVCAACHGLKLVPYRKLQDLGFSEAEAKALAATYTYSEIGDDGEPKERPGRLSDPFKAPYANDNAARAANNGALPPDLSLITKARPDGANYVHSLLTGYEAPTKKVCILFDENGACATLEEGDTRAAYRLATPEDEALAVAEAAEFAKQAEISKKQLGTDLALTESAIPHKAYACLPSHAEGECHRLGAGMNYNPYFAGRQIAMPAPLSDGMVTYQDGTQASVDQMSKDLVNFLQWAAEPEMEQRKAMGLKVIVFLVLMTGFFFVAYKRVWKRLK